MERELGGGGMSRVFVALETAFGRRVVVKLLSPDLVAGVDIDRFRREIQMAARLQHRTSLARRGGCCLVTPPRSRAAFDNPLQTGQYRLPSLDAARVAALGAFGRADIIGDRQARSSVRRRFEDVRDERVFVGARFTEEAMVEQLVLESSSLLRLRDDSAENERDDAEEGSAEFDRASGAPVGLYARLEEVLFCHVRVRERTPDFFWRGVDLDTLFDDMSHARDGCNEGATSIERCEVLSLGLETSSPPWTRYRMLKWIGGCLLLIVVLLVGAMAYGYKKLSSGADEPPPSAMVDAPAGRVFATLASGDSLRLWRLEGTLTSSSRHGMLAPGDTILVRQPNLRDTTMQRSSWIVTEVVPGRLLVSEMRKRGMPTVVRRDSLVDLGDSTLVVMAFTAPPRDSVSMTSAERRAMPEVGRKMIVGAMRIQAEAELSRLKRRIEGSSASPDTTPGRKKD